MRRPSGDPRTGLFCFASSVVSAARLKISRTRGATDSYKDVESVFNTQYEYLMINWHHSCAPVAGRLGLVKHGCGGVLET